MKKLLLILVLLITLKNTHAQVKAVTEVGRTVILYSNGTWKYEKDSLAHGTTDSAKLNPVKFTKSPGETFLVKSKVTNTAIYIDPTKWALATHRDNEVNPEYRFTLKTGTGMAMLETEKTQIGLEAMADIALANAQKAAIDARIVSQEYRMVNNKKVLVIEMAGTIKSIRFRYFGYYFSNQTGTTQLLCFTSEALYKDAKKELERFLNGFTLIE